MHDYNENLKWRYAVKKFDESRQVSDEDLNALKEAIQLTASSYGLQPYQVFIISDPEVKKQLRTAAYNQSQITDASHIIVFASIKNVGDAHVDDYVKNISEIREIELSQLAGFSEMLKTNLKSMSKERRDQWTAKQTYIALGNLLSAAASLRIDTCPMEGFEPVEFGEILGLDHEELVPIVVAAVGYRAKEDKYQYLEKVRKPEEKLFVRI